MATTRYRTLDVLPVIIYSENLSYILEHVIFENYAQLSFISITVVFILSKI